VRTEGWYNVRDQGATGDGATDDTKAIQTAIDQCSRTGGRVVFPPGRYRTGMVRLKSHITIELSNQAVWQAIPDLTLYPDLPIRSAAPAFLYAGNEEEIHITGEGKIHGSGDAHNVFVPGPNLSKGPRPYGILMHRCRNISFSGIGLENSGFWMLRPQECDDVLIRGLRIPNHSNFNNDGIDIVDCHRVIVSDCFLDCEDDAICLKSESDRGVADVAITNCVISSHASALKFGTASRGAFNRIVASNCVVMPSSARETLHPAQMVDGITGIDLVCTDGASLTNVSFNNIVMDGVLTPFFIRLGNRNSRFQGEAGTVAGASRVGTVENVTLSNILAVNAGAVACSISGYPGHYVKNVKLSNIDLGFKGSGTAADLSADVPERPGAYPSTRMFGMNLPGYGLFLRHVRNISIDCLHLRPPAEEPRPELVADDVHGLEVTRFRSSHPKRAKPQWRLSNSTGIQVNGEQ
jgi:polygalacturonase